LRVIAVLLGVALTRKCWHGAWEEDQVFFELIPNPPQAPTGMQRPLQSLETAEAD
jgi:hypothetical protein